jgi:hypothetical protein
MLTSSNLITFFIIYLTLRRFLSGSVYNLSITTWLFQSQNRWIFFKFSILLTMTFRELVIRFPSLSWHHTYIVFINQHSHNTNTQYTCPQYYISIFIHLHYIILTYSWVCILVLISLSTRVYTRVLNNNFTH